MASEKTSNGSKGRGKKYWRSLEELADTPKFRKFLEREFPVRASEWLGGLGDASRRGFLKLMGASLALAGLASCRRWPEDEILPYARRPANRMDGVPVHYATALEMCGVGIGVIAASVDGRPIKVEGNKEHPLGRGATDAYTQATVLDLYDPDRSRTVLNGGKASSWDAFFAAWPELLKGRVAILAEASRSPSVARLRGGIKGEWFEYEPVSNDNARAGAQIAFGKPLRPVLQLDKADVVVAIDIDLFSGDPESTKWARDFASRRRLHSEADASHGAVPMNRLWAIESNFSLSGSNADHRRAVKPSQIAAYVGAIAGKLGVALESKEASGIDDAFVARLAEDVRAAGNRVVFVAGPRQPKAVHAVVAALNARQGAVGNTIVYTNDEGDPREAGKWSTHVEQIAGLTDRINKGEFDTLLIIGGNPAYNAPADLKFAEAIKKVKASIHLSCYNDETSQLCTWHLPRTHYLEAWGDVRAYDGTVSITQPLIEPMFGGLSVIEVLSALAGRRRAGMEIVRGTLGGDEWKWKQALYHGVVEGTATLVAANVALTAGDGVAAEFGKMSKAGSGNIEVSLYAGNLFDGRFANNGWLSELPEPMTRLTWDNAALMHPKTAKTLGVVSDDVIAVSTPNGGTVKLPVLVQPGVAEGTIALAVGYGRKVGAIASAEGKGVDRDGYAFFTSAGGMTATGLTASKTGERYLLATVQDHNVIDAVGKNRMHALVPELVMEGTLHEYGEDRSLGVPKVLSLSMWNEHDYQGHRWGMAIDLTTCTGCSACVIACQAENNVPIVGKEQVSNGREMQWIRIDRYFKSDEKREFDDMPQAVHQPILCMHCETAPCEEVCPVAATTHSDEGLNMMTYNRCIGTRYCSNNCPYKVRRFNFFDYNSGSTKDLYTPNIIRKDLNELQKMQKNPQVTVRSRGVMEKCTYCVQRIEGARITAKTEGNRKIKDGEFTTACAQACPTGAIVFGDLNDKESAVRKLHDVKRTYGLLDAELNTKPRTRYIAKLRNPVAGLDAPYYTVERHRKDAHGGGHAENGHNAETGDAGSHGAPASHSGGTESGTH